MKDRPDTCLEIENSLPLWVGGDLEPDAQESVEQHLAHCARCAERAARACGARAALREGLSLGAERIGKGLDPWPGIRSTMQAQGFFVTSVKSHAASVASVPFVRARTRMAPRLRRIALGWSAAAALVLGLVFTWTQISPQLLGGATTPEVKPPSLSERGAGGSGLAAAPVVDATIQAPASGALVVQPAGLRRLRPNERRLRDTAQIYALPDDSAPGSFTEVQGSPVSLERAIGAPPR
jgi:hypothetical protein